MIMQRYNKNRISNLLFPIYKYIWERSRNSLEMTTAYWSGEGGALHAMNQYNKPKEEWFKTYGDVYNLILNQLNDGDRIIEIGCGVGQWAKRLELFNRDVNYLGVDVNEFSIRKAKDIFKNYNNIRFECASIDPEFNVSQFNMVIAIQFLFFMPKEVVINILDTIAVDTLIILSEPKNLTEDDTPLKFRKSLGFSHDYSTLLQISGFDIISRNFVITGADTGRITLCGKKIR